MKKEIKKEKISIKIPAEIGILREIRKLVLNFLKNKTELKKEWIHRMQSVADELCANAIEYGSAEKKTIKLSIIYNPKKSVEIIVEDTGTGKKQITAKKLKKIFTKKVEEKAILDKNTRGRGLAKIVKNWTDEVECRQKGKGIEIHAIKYL